MHLPDERDPAVNVLWRGSGNGRFETLRMNPQTGEPVDIRQSMGGDFFYRFHFELRTAQKGRWTLEGRWVVGVATLLMFMALLTGVVTHRRIFKDFFTFPPGKGGQRAWLDAHNVSGRAGAAVLLDDHLQRADDLPLDVPAQRHRHSVCRGGWQGGLEHLLCRPARRPT